MSIQSQHTGRDLLPAAFLKQEHVYLKVNTQAVTFSQQQIWNKNEYTRFAALWSHYSK